MSVEAAGEGGGTFVASGADTYRLESALSFATVPVVRPLGLALIAAARGRTLTFDLALVTAVDSAGLALLIDWLAVARAGDCQLRYSQPAETLLSLARLSEVESLLNGHHA
ncbi:MAG TPA: STAS domain-containing protein [Steroidobacteraceae bacterium]|jgi:phospholipid transport system transporter-binding protein